MASKIYKSCVSVSSPCPKSSSSSHYSSSGQHLHLPKKPETKIAKSINVSASPISTPTTKDTTSKRVISKMSILTHFWKEIQGYNNWENLIEPLNPLLRKEIIRYGELVTACYKAFDLDPSSRRYLNCKYGKKNMFNDIGLPNSGYHVTKYIYATPDTNMSESCGRWIGYIAVSDDEDSIRKLGRRDIVICFRGTVTSPEWKANLMSSLTPARLDPHNPRPEVKVESGFLSLYTSDESSFTKFGVGSCREQLLSEVSRLLNKYKGEELSITLAGHSMGSSLALLLAYDISELGLNNILNCNGHSCSTKIPITVFSYGGPRVGNNGFKDRLEELGVKVLRIVNANDPITKLPGVVFNENLFRVLGGMGRSTALPADTWRWSSSNCYSHVGVELLLDFFNMHNLSCVHDLETYINLLRYPQIINHKNHHQEGSRIDFVDRARKLMVSGAQNLNVLPLRNAANNMMSLLQSQRT